MLHWNVSCWAVFLSLLDFVLPRRAQEYSWVLGSEQALPAESLVPAQGQLLWFTGYWCVILLPFLLQKLFSAGLSGTQKCSGEMNFPSCFPLYSTVLKQWDTRIVFTEFTPNFAWPSRQDHLCLTWMRTAPWISAQVKNSRSEWIAKAFYQLEEPSACTEVIVCGGRARNGCSWTEMLRIIVLLHWDMSVLTHWVLSVSFPPVPSQSVWWHVTSLWKLMPWVSQWLPSAATTPTWERLHILSWLPSAPIWKGLAFERRAR